MEGFGEKSKDLVKKDKNHPPPENGFLLTSLSINQTATVKSAAGVFQ